MKMKYVTIEGSPLADAGLDEIEVIDQEGRVVGPLLGLAVFTGETIREAIERSLPAGHYVRVKPKAPK